MTGSVLEWDKHTFTRESHDELMLGLKIRRSEPTSDRGVSRLMVCTAIPHSGQLNITNPISLTLEKLMSVKLKIMSLPSESKTCNVSR
jgi:hypothetical protein